MTQADIQIIPTPGDLHSNVASFVRMLHSDNKSPRTLRAYTDATNLLSRYLMEQGHSTDVADITLKDLQGFQRHEIDRTSASSADNRHRALNSFFKWWVAEEEEITGKVPGNPTDRWERPQVERKLIPVVELDAIEKLLDTCAGGGFANIRDYGILITEITTGMRRSEIAGLRWSETDPDECDVDLHTGVLKVMGKGGKERHVPIDADTVRALDRYIRIRRRHPRAESPWLWIGPKGRLGSDGIRQMLERRANQAGIGHVHLHQFRHTAAHHFLKDNGSESDLMRLMGWSSPEMVRRYGESAAAARALDAGRKFGIGKQLRERKRR